MSPHRRLRPTDCTALRQNVWRTVAVLMIIGIGVGCREKSRGDRKTATSPTVASLVPAATDLIIGMGAGDHLVAVSNYDTVRDGTADLPRVGDYFNTDWERLRKLRPGVMIIQLAKERVQEGFGRSAAAAGIELVNVKLDRLTDLYPTIDAIGLAVAEPAKASALSQALRGRLEGVSRRVAALPKVKTLLVLNDDGGALAGVGNVLDDLLTIAGGENAATSLGSPWPTADKETLRALAPEVVLILDPNPRSDALDGARRYWKSMPDVPASRDNRIYLIGDWHVLLHGSHVAELAESMAERLHPRASATNGETRTHGVGFQPVEGMWNSACGEQIAGASKSANSLLGLRTRATTNAAPGECQ